MPSDEDIKRFARETLGCACPEEVFDHIESHSNIRLNEDVVIKWKFNIGNRLLVYIVEIDHADILEKYLSPLVLAGIMERDGLKFNRFRLVLVAGDAAALRGDADRLFGELSFTDDKVHLHVIERDEISSFKSV